MIVVNTLTRELCEARLAHFLRILGTTSDPRMIWTAEHFLREGFPLKWELSRVALVQGNIAGFLIASFKSQRTAHVHLLVVKPEFQSQGVGKLLLSSLERLKDKYHFERVTLWVYCDKLPAIEFYKKRNFHELATRWKNKHSLLLMEKTLMKD